MISIVGCRTFPSLFTGWYCSALLVSRFFTEWFAKITYEMAKGMNSLEIYRRTSNETKTGKFFVIYEKCRNGARSSL